MRARYLRPIQTQLKMALTTIEVFRTSVTDKCKAQQLQAQLGDLYPHYQITFDVDDCDHVLVVKCATGIDVPTLVFWLNEHHCCAEVLPDDQPQTDPWELLGSENRH